MYVLSCVCLSCYVAAADKPRWVQTPMQTSHSGRWQRSLSSSGSRSDAGVAACSCVISFAVRWRTNSGLPRHLNVMFLPSGIWWILISIFASATTSADALQLCTSWWTTALVAYVLGTAAAAHKHTQFIYTCKHICYAEYYQSSNTGVMVVTYDNRWVYVAVIISSCFKIRQQTWTKFCVSIDYIWANLNWKWLSLWLTTHIFTWHSHHLWKGQFLGSIPFRH